MCAMRKEITFDFLELAQVEIGCSCGCEIVLDLANENTLAPARCPSCNLDFPEGLLIALKGFRDGYRYFAMHRNEKRGARIGFRIPWPEG